jgi:glycosyltransferase involved in cell wall biosynthesis
MKILHVNSYDTYGGAARAAYRLYQGLNKFGITSNMLVQKKYSKDSNVKICDSQYREKIHFYDNLPLLSYPKKSQDLFSIASIPNTDIVEYINSSDADIVHLHWITNGFFSIKDLSRINKPLLWSLHDMWAFTGGCHYADKCEQYINQCQDCPILQSNEKEDLSFKVFNIKKNTYSYLNNLTIIGLSQWMAECAKKSLLLEKKTIIQLPNCLDTEFFKKENNEITKDYFNLPKDKKLILFGAMNSTSDPRKGYKELTIALQYLEIKNIAFIVFGNNEDSLQQFNIPTYYLGPISNEEILVKLYSAVDVMIVPSLQECFGQTAIEAMACKIPVVAFNTTGLKDIVDHKINGYLAKCFDSQDLAKGIEWVLTNEEYFNICTNARKKIVTTFSYNAVIPKYINIYKNILENKSSISPTNLENDNEYIFSNILKQINLQPTQNLYFSNQFNVFYEKIQELNLEEVTYVIYGYGTIGKTIQLLIPNLIVAFVDQKSTLITENIQKNEIYSPLNLTNIKYDKIIISVLGREKEIVEYLVEKLNINKNKIITLKI